MYLTPIDQLNTVKIVPIPFCVIKSLITSPTTLQNVKIFINLCHSEMVPPPKTPFNPLTTFTQIMNNEWEIPIITSPQRWDTDKKGNKCIVYDCLINSNNINDLETINELKQIVIEWCIESCELSDNLIINRDVIKFPKISYKGGDSNNNNNPIPLEIKNESKEDSPPLDNTFTQWKNDLLYKQELAQESDGLKTLFPQKQSVASKATPLIQEIDSTQRSIKQNLTLTKSIINYNVSMKRTNDITTYKLRIEIDISSNNTSNPPLSILKAQYDGKENNLIISNLETSQFKSNDLVIPLPNLYNKIDAYTSNFKLFYIQDKSKLVIFI